MVAKEALCESTGVRRTKSGGILVELKAGDKGGDITLKIKKSTGGKVLVFPRLSRASVEIRDIELETRDDLRQDIVNGLKIKDANEVEVKSLRAAPRGTQMAIAVVPASYITGKNEHMKIRIGLTIAAIRVLPKVVRCF